MPARALGGPVEIWFQDEARVGQKGSHAYIWAPIGSRPLMVRDNRHDSAYLFCAATIKVRGALPHQKCSRELTRCLIRNAPE